jgi:uncharacterized protein (DUF2141 family)
MKSFSRIGLLSLLLSVGVSLLAQSLNVHVKGIRSTTGQLCVAVFANETEFKSEKPIWEMKYPKDTIKKGEFRLNIQLKAGKYGLSVLDDENGNGRMNYNMLGIPKEGFGFSNYFHRGIKVPSFNQFSFFLEKDEIPDIRVVMKYF